MKKTKKSYLKEIAGEIDALDNMLTSLVELLEEKGILTQEEWEKKIEQKIHRAKGLVGYREIQFSSDEE